MKTIPIAAIKISPDRQRQNFDLKTLNELGESIKKNGLFHPIVLRVRKGESTDLGQGYIEEWLLVAGERRLRAISDIYALGGSFNYDNTLVPLGEVPFVDLGELSDLAREEAEFDENTKRANLSWQEEANAVQRLAAARAKHEGVSPISAEIVREVARTAIPAAADLPTGSLGVHQEKTRRQIIVAKYMADPEIKGAKDVDEAFKILKRKEETAKRVQLAAEVGRTYSADTAHTALHQDSLVWMKEYKGSPFDVICTDPIYGIGADEFGDSGGKAAGAHFYKDDYETWKQHISVLATEGFRITKPQAHLYAFCDITRFAEFKAILEKAGWDCFRTPIIWHKPNGSRTPWVDRGPQRKYEIILYADKGKKSVTKIFPDLVTYPADENLGHQAQKPVALFIDLLRRSCNAGDSILDPFCGSGPVFPAGNDLKLKVTGLEIDAAAYGLCLKRLDQLKDIPELTGLN